MNTSFLLISILLVINLICSKIISIPFNFKFLKSSYYSYNSTDFLNEHYKKELLLQMNIGTPTQKVITYLNQDSSCFQLILSELNITNDYNPGKSKTFNINKIQNVSPNLNSVNDIINFNPNETHKMNLVFNKDLNINMYDKSFIPEIGLNIPLIYSGNNIYSCPNFIYDLRKMKAIDKAIFSIKYNNKFEGQFILGNVLHKYDPSHFKEEHYHAKYFYSKFGFSYNNIYMKYPWNKTEYLNITGNGKKKEVEINLNSGFIIGTEDFKNFIHNIFFKYLVEKKICNLDLVKYNQTDIKLGNEFYLYNCNHMKFTGQDNPRFQKTNYYEEFPKLIINSKYFEYDFELTNKDLFEQIYSRDYFLIIFPKNIKDQINKDIWYLGEPFYKKYPFTIDLDAKTIGFYLNNEDVYNKVNDTKNIINKDNNNDKNIIMKDNNSKTKNILIKIAEILFGIGLLICGIYIGMKVKEGRKKRANELKDDSYEYISDDNKDINTSLNETKNKQSVELNSKLGL